MDNQHYRYCFSCEKWKNKSEINEVNWGEQPGGSDGRSYNCNVCRKDLGDQIIIFRCHDHEEEILKVQGTLEGKNKEKVFYDKCPQEEQKTSIERVLSIALVGSVIISLLLGLFLVIKMFRKK